MALCLASTSHANPTELAGWEQQAQAVTITRDDWGIAHVHGKTDADAVFGMTYAQAEDDFNRVETNYLISLGRLAEAQDAEDSALWQDLRQRLFIDHVQLKKLYAQSPIWLRRLMDSWANGLNYYLAMHPDVHPRVITRFEPWMALSFTEGSIGGDIEKVNLDALKSFYGAATDAPLAKLETPPGWIEPTGSNGIAIAPKLTVDGHALLWINPHTSFFFRSELQMSSDEGLNAYGAVTWGQFFVYQGFNQHVGWMHTSAGVDVVDEFAEIIERKDGKTFYRYGKELRPITSREITLSYRTKDGALAERTFTAYFSHRGPIVRSLDDQWIAQALMNKPIPALEQSWLRTKTHDLASFMKVAERKANSSNNTLFASGKGEIAMLLPQFVPKRDNRFDYTKPVDGSNPEADWQGLTPLDQLPQVVNPSNGWTYNTNNWPYSAAGADSPKQADYPRYMDTFGENPRGVNAMRLLTDINNVTLPSLITLAFDSYLPAFAQQVPILVADYDALPTNDPLRAKLVGQIQLLRDWDYRWGIASMPTSLAVFWGDRLWDLVNKPGSAPGATAKDRLDALVQASNQLEKDFGSWGVPWGEINRFQRNNGDIVQKFDDEQPSI
ncbi:MAG: penicillin acylase family protein, partial [Dokdonella sp.]